MTAWFFRFLPQTGTKKSIGLLHDGNDSSAALALRQSGHNRFKTFVSVKESVGKALLLQVTD